MKSMMYTKPGQFFTQQDIQSFLKINHNKTEVGEITVYDFKTQEYEKNPYRNPLYHVNLFEIPKGTEIDPYDRRYRDYIHFADYYKGSGFFINSQQTDHIMDLIQTLVKVDQDSAKQMLDRYHQEFNESKEAKSLSNKIVTETNLMMQYLRKNKICAEDLNINVEELNQFANDKKELEKALNNLTKDLPEPIDVEGYNDLDYYPYLFEDTYIIEDVSADRMLICKKELNKTSWYQVERWPDFILGIDGWISDTLYEHHQLSKYHFDKLDDFNLIAEFDGNKLVKSTIGIYYLNLLQGYIMEKLVKENKIKPNLPDLTFEELVKHYAFQKEVWNIEERSIVPLLKELMVIDGKITYEGFGLVDPSLIANSLKSEAINEHHFRDIENISGLHDLEQKHKNSINAYLNKLLESDNTDETKKLISMIQDIKEKPTLSGLYFNLI